jgi:glycosyltransferase involved in cell wall biosynthesis
LLNDFALAQLELTPCIWIFCVAMAGAGWLPQPPCAAARAVGNSAGFSFFEVKFSIVTPSFRNSQWLKLCVASVADQRDVDAEHIVQDAGSDDGTLDWLTRDPRVQAHVEKDKGMYDAINRGLRRARGEVLAYLNCDEQYLPGALKHVSDFFARHPEVDIVFGACIVVDARGNYLCERRPLTPRLFHIWASGNLGFLTAATFMRRRVIDIRKLFFNPELRDVGDAEWALRVVKAGLSTAVLPEFLSVFTETGNNVGAGASTAKERRAFVASAPRWARLLAPLLVLRFRLRRWRANHYQCKPHDYSIYTLDNPDCRKTFHVANPTFRWARPKAASV